ncbi:Uncharacterised protein [Escherichia coli]|nr:Uncharacterised protein [Escherichia coli]
MMYLLYWIGMSYLDRQYLQVPSRKYMHVAAGIMSVLLDITDLIERYTTTQYNLSYARICTIWTVNLLAASQLPGSSGHHYCVCPFCNAHRSRIAR